MTSFGRSLIRFVILGPPGSGKGTISSWLRKDYGLKYLNTGDILRHQMKAKTESGLEAEAYINEGQLVPDKLVTTLIIDHLKSDFENISWLLDGFPRTIKQAESLCEQAAIDKVINLDVPFDEIINRTKSRLIHEASGRVYNLLYRPPKVPGLDDVTGEELEQRSDDHPNTVRKRLMTYQKITKPVLGHYRAKDLLVEFSGNESSEIYPRLKKYLDQEFKVEKRERTL